MSPGNATVCRAGLIALALAGCYLPDAAGEDAGREAEAPNTSTDSGLPAPSGVPCDVEQVLAARCLGCHGTRPSAPMPLVSRDDFSRPAPSAPSSSVAAVVSLRMHDAARPMPPSGLLPAAERDLVERWLQAGLPGGLDCAQSSDAGVVDAGPDPFAAAPTCTSQVSWTSGNLKSPLMNPGRACITCHRPRNLDEGKEDAPEGVAGTVFPTAHEPDLCNGLPGNGTVVLTGADGAEFRLPVNAAGNFYLFSSPLLIKPYRARVEYQGRVRHMGATQTSGDCNSCHTQAGANGAPGRIVAP